MRGETRRGDQAHAHGHGDRYGTHDAKSSRLARLIPRRCVGSETVLDSRLARRGLTRIRRRHGTARGQPHHGRNGDDVNGRCEPKWNLPVPARAPLASIPPFLVDVFIDLREHILPAWHQD